MTDHPILFNGAMVRAILDGRKTQTRRKLKPWPGYQSEWLTQETLHRSPSCYLAHVDGLLGAQMAHPLAGTMQTYGRVEENSPLTWVRLPHKIGDRLWVREAWCDVNNYGAPTIAHRADGNLADLMDDPSFLKPDGSFDYGAPRLRFGKSKRCLPFCDWANDLLSGIEGKWRPSIHMPRWASRLTLVVTDVRVQRLKDISEEDAIAEGMIARPARDTFGQDYTGWRSEWPAEADTPEAAHRHALGSARFALANLWNATYGPEAWDANPWVTAITFKTNLCNIDQMGETT